MEKKESETLQFLCRMNGLEEKKISITKQISQLKCALSLHFDQNLPRFASIYCNYIE